MADWTTLADALFTTGKPVLGSTQIAHRDNYIAIAEGAAGAASLQGAGWLPYNMTSNNLSATGEIWSFGSDGTFASLDAPDFVAGYDYLFMGVNIDRLVTATLNASIVFDGPTVVGGIFSSNVVVNTGMAFSLEVQAPRLSRNSFAFRSSASQGNLNEYPTVGAITGVGGAEFRVRSVTPANRIKNIRFIQGAAGLDGGEIRMLRRRNWGAE